MGDAPKTETTKSDATKKTRKGDVLHVAYTPDESSPNAGSLVDAVIFGTRLDALEHAAAQDPQWRVVTVAKGSSLRDAVMAR